MVGLEGYKGTWIDQIGVICATPHIGDGNWTSRNYSPSTKVGKRNFGATSFRSICSSNHAVKNFRGRSGWYVNSITAACHRLAIGARATATHSGNVSVNSNTSDGANYGPHTCPDATPAVGIRGRADSYVDSFGLICGYIYPSVPTVSAPVKGSDVTTKRPTFRWDHTLRTNEGYRICINLSSNAACSIGGTIAANIAGHTNSWTPAQDLPYNRGDVVYFRIGACNTNDCKWTLSSFRFMP
jgi:hypothetical protein